MKYQPTIVYPCVFTDAPLSCFVIKIERLPAPRRSEARRLPNFMAECIQESDISGLSVGV